MHTHPLPFESIKEHPFSDNCRIDITNPQAITNTTIQKEDGVTTACSLCFIIAYDCLTALVCFGLSDSLGVSDPGRLA